MVGSETDSQYIYGCRVNRNLSKIYNVRKRKESNKFQIFCLIPVRLGLEEEKVCLEGNIMSSALDTFKMRCQ